MSYGKEEKTHRQPCRHIPQSSPYSLFLAPLWPSCPPVLHYLPADGAWTVAPLPSAAGARTTASPQPVRGPRPPQPPRSRCEDHGRHSLPAVATSSRCSTASLPPPHRRENRVLLGSPPPAQGRVPPLVPLRRRKNLSLPLFPSTDAKIAPSPASSRLPRYPPHTLPPRHCQNGRPIPCRARVGGINNVGWVLPAP
jgi:hypothetical protein